MFTALIFDSFALVCTTVAGARTRCHLSFSRHGAMVLKVTPSLLDCRTLGLDC